LLFEGAGDAAVSSFLVAAYQQFNGNYPKFYKMDMLSKLGWLSAAVLLENDFRKEAYQADEVSVVLANANASLDTDIKYYDTITDMASPALFVYTLPNIVIGEICIRHGFKGENAFFVTEQFETGCMQQYVSTLMQSPGNKACICGWVDVLNETYEAALYLVEQMPTAESITFTAENLLTLYQQ
jgi:hypothetical protein